MKSAFESLEGQELREERESKWILFESSRFKAECVCVRAWNVLRNVLMRELSFLIVCVSVCVYVVFVLLRISGSEC